MMIIALKLAELNKKIAGTTYFLGGAYGPDIQWSSLYV